MDQYHKIQTVYKRDPETKFKTLLIGDYSLPVFKYLEDLEWVWTEKVDGTNIRVMLTFNSEGESSIFYGGKTENAQIPAKLGNNLVSHFGPRKDQMAELFKVDVCLYGEGYGAGIQKGGGCYGPEQGFVLFDVRIGDWWLRREDVVDIGDRLEIPVVPIIGQGTLPQMVLKVQDGLTSQWGDFAAEGIVARPAVELFSRGGERVITKLKHKDFRREDQG